MLTEPPAGPLHEVVLVRYSNYYGQRGGGFRPYLRRLDRQLLAENAMQIYELYQDPDAGGAVAEPAAQTIGRGTLVEQAVRTVAADTPLTAAGAARRPNERRGLVPAGMKSQLKIFLAADQRRLVRGASMPLVGAFCRAALRHQELLADLLMRIRAAHPGRRLLMVNHSIIVHLDLGLARAAHRAGMPAACVHHGGFDDTEQRQAMRVACRLYDRAGGVTTRGLDPELQGRVTGLQDGLEPEYFAKRTAPGDFRQRRGISAEAAMILDVARVHPGKGPLDLLTAAGILSRRCPEQRLALVYAGVVLDAGTRAEIEKQAAGLGKVRAIFTGHLDEQEMAAAYAAADLVVLPSHTEGFPRALMEAAAMGVAAVATDVGGAREIIDDGTTGMLVAAHDPAGLAGAIGKMLDQPETRKAYGRAARAKALREFTMADLAARHTRFYLDALTHAEQRPARGLTDFS